MRKRYKIPLIVFTVLVIGGVIITIQLPLSDNPAYPVDCTIESNQLSVLIERLQEQKELQKSEKPGTEKYIQLGQEIQIDLDELEKIGDYLTKNCGMVTTAP